MGLGLHVRKSSSRNVKLKNQKKYFIVVDLAPGEFLEFLNENCSRLTAVFTVRA